MSKKRLESISRFQDEGKFMCMRAHFRKRRGENAGHGVSLSHFCLTHLEVCAALRFRFTGWTGGEKRRSPRFVPLSSTCGRRLSPMFISVPRNVSSQCFLDFA